MSSLRVRGKQSKIETTKKREEDVIWKRIFTLPTEPVWYLSNLIINYAVVFYSLAVSVKGECVAFEIKTSAADTLVYTIDAIYFIDIILNILILYVPALSLQEWNPTYRPISIIMLEIVSLFPCRLILYLFHEDNYQVYCLISLVRLLRLARIVYFHAKFGRMSLTYYLRIVEFVIKLGIAMLACYSLLCNTLCWSMTKDQCAKECPFVQTIARILSKLTNYGLKTDHDKHHRIEGYWVGCVGSTHYLTFIFILTVAVAHMTVGMKDASYYSYLYLNMFKSLYTARVKYDVSQRLLDKTHTIFKVGWTNYGGLDTGQEFYRMLTPAIASELMIDVCWPAFKHSNLFRSADTAYLRCLALEMTQEFVMPGDFIYRKGEWKDKILYLTEGTIEILSEEDGESPILSLGSGTCLGEMGMVLSYPSVNCVRAKTFCEFHVLDRRSFMASFKKYPEEGKEIVRRIRRRIEQSKLIDELSELQKRRTFTERRYIDTYTIVWLKNTLHKLMSSTKELAFRHEFQNIYLVDEIDKKIFERLVFTASYLDMLVIKERVSTDSDPIFVRTKFPFILQPHSVITIVWEILIITLTMVVIILIPYASFLTDEYVSGYTTIVQCINLVFVADLMVQCCTAIKTHKIQHISCLTIAIARLQQLVFWTDILSCLPLELYSPAILVEITPNKCAMLHLNKVVKIWRILRVFANWSKQFTANCFFVTYAKLIFIQIYLCYILFAVLVYLEGLPGESTDEPRNKLDILFDVIQMLTAVGLVQIKTGLHGFFLFTQFVSVIFKWTFASRISALFISSKSGMLRIQNKAYRIVSLIKAHNLPRVHLRRLTNNYECDWELDYGRSSHVHPKFMANLATVNYAEVADDIFGETLKSMKFFRNLPNNSYWDLMKHIKFVTRPSNETVMYNGDITRYIQIFFKGSLDLLDVYGNILETIDSPRPLNVIDVILDLPAMHTYVTRTTCSFVHIERNEFTRFMLKYTHFHSVINDVKSSLTREREAVLESFDFEKISGVTPSKIYVNVVKNSFYLFGYKLRPGSFEEFDYFLPFDYYYPFDWIKYILLRFTILPNGYFIYWWEGVRAVMALISATVHFVTILNNPTYQPLFYSLYGYGLIDMYFRLHVCYYDEKGVLIKHPIMTARHYLTHGFLIDCLALLPIAIMINEKDQLTFFLGSTVRLLSLGRYWQYMQTLKFSVVKSESKIVIVLYAPLLFVLINYVGSLIINLQCTFDSSMQTNADLVNFSCVNNSFLVMSNFHKPIDQLRAQLYGMYFAASFLLLYGFRGYDGVGPATRFAASVLSFVGQLITFTLIAKVLCLYSAHKTFLSEQQAGMYRLKHFMKSVNVSNSLAKTVVDTYEVNWKTTKGRTIHSVMGPFSTPFRRDLYYEIYGSRLLASSAFAAKTPMFYRNILDHLTYRIVPKGGYLSTINDIESTTYILYSGVADVLAPDGTKLTTITEGAMFGNMEQRKFVRIGVSIVAMSHVEIFAIQSIVFYKILQYFPAILAEYRTLRQIYFTYIPTKRGRIKSSEYITEEDMAKKGEGVELCQAFSPHSVTTKIWTLLIVVFTCYLTVLLDLYHMISKDFSNKILLMLYASDILFIVYFLILDRLAYEDSKGYLITDLIKIKKRLREDRLRTWISIASVFPIDVLILASSINEDTRKELYPCSRLNRALRLIHVVYYFSSNIDKVNVKFVVLKVAAIICWTTLFLVTFAAILTMFSCHYEVNLNPHIPSCVDINELSPLKKITFFIAKMYLGVHILTVTASGYYYPHGALIILFFVCSFVIGTILQALVYGQVFSMYNDLSIQKTLFKRSISRLFFFMEREDVSVALVSKIKRYVQLIWMTTAGEMYPSLLKIAPRYLKDAIMNSAFGHLIFNHPVFSKCHPDCLRQIVQHMEVWYFFSDEYVQFKGTIDDCMYFIFTGTITVLYDDYLNTKEVLKVLRAGDSFGIRQGLFRRTPHEYAYRCKRYSIVLRLHLDNWKYLLKHFPATKQRIYTEIENYNGL